MTISIRRRTEPQANRLLASIIVLVNHTPVQHLFGDPFAELLAAVAVTRLLKSLSLSLTKLPRTTPTAPRSVSHSSLARSAPIAAGPAGQSTSCAGHCSMLNASGAKSNDSQRVGVSDECELRSFAVVSRAFTRTGLRRLEIPDELSRMVGSGNFQAGDAILLRANSNSSHSSAFWRLRVARRNRLRRR